MIKKIIKSFLLDLVMFLLDPNKEKFPAEKELYDKAESAGKKYLKALILEVLKDLDEQEQNENNLSK